MSLKDIVETICLNTGIPIDNFSITQKTIFTDGKAKGNLHFCKSCNQDRNISFVKLDCGHELCSECSDKLYDSFKDELDTVILYNCPFCLSKIKNIIYLINE